MIVIDFVKNFSDEERNLIKKYVEENQQDLNLHTGVNYAVDVSDAIDRTASVDIEKIEGWKESKNV